MSESQAFVIVSGVDILTSMAPLLAIACISNILGLGISSPLIVSTIRTFVQLSILAFILDPIFLRGVDLWWLVVGYCFLMILLASYESSTRAKYYVVGQFWMVLFPMIFNIVTVALYAFLVVIKPEPRWDPQHVVPIVGMLLGNCINGISLALNSLFTSLVECSREVELLQAFGANEREATARLVREAIRNGTMPQLNSMAIIGLISIPGMMTGQILGGTSVTQAARYQILIVYFIAMCSFGTILMELHLALGVCFDSRGILQTDILQKRDKKPSFAASVVSSIRGCFRNFSLSPRQHSASSSNCAGESTFLSPYGSMSVATPSRGGKESENIVLSLDRLCHGFKVGEDEESNAKENEYKNESTTRILFENVSFKLYSGDSALVMGPSGAGKSTLLRIIAGLTDADAQRIKLFGIAQDSFASMPRWRKRVRYVPQTKVEIPGTPNDFIRKISSFGTWNNKNSVDDSSSLYLEMESTVTELTTSWGIGINLLNSEWKFLSGGESQRILIAISLASLSENSVILLDESTSALDQTRKIQVENTVKEFCTRLRSVAIWISHDPGQKDRMRLA